MNRMFTKQEIIALIQQYAPGFDPSTIESGDILQNAILGLNEDGEAVKGNLFGKYVRIVEAPDGTMSDEVYDAVIHGCFMHGTFAGIRNPVFFPCVTENESGGLGFVAGATANGCMFGEYSAYKNQYGNNVTLRFKIMGTAAAAAALDNIRSINGKNLPAFPTVTAGKKYHYVYDNGTLTWHEGNGLFLHVIVFDVGSSNTFTIRFISDSSTACELNVGTGNFTIPGSTFIQPANMGNVVIVPLDANKFAPDIYAFDSATGAFTNNITLASVTSDTVTPVG